MYRRYAYLTSNDSYRRVSAFTQEDPAYPRWLLVQEFESGCFDELKRKEAKHWWQKNGWHGVKVAFCRLSSLECI